MKAAGGIPNRGKDRNAWKEGARFDFENSSRKTGS